MDSIHHISQPASPQTKFKTPQSFNNNPINSNRNNNSINTNNNAFKNGTKDNSYQLQNNSYFSHYKKQFSNIPQSYSDQIKNHQFTYNPNSSIDPSDNQESLAFHKTKYSQKELKDMPKGNREASTQINKMQNSSIEPSKYFSAKKDNFIDAWNSKFPNLTTKRILQVKETAIDVYDMNHVNNVLSEKEALDTIKQTMYGEAKKNVSNTTKEAAKKILNSASHCNIDEIKQVVQTSTKVVKKSTEVVHSLTTLSDEKALEVFAAYKEMQSINAGQIISNITVNTAINNTLNTTGTILQSAPLPIAKVTGTALKGAAAINQGVTVYQNVSTLSKVFDKKEALEKSNPGLYKKTLDNLRVKAEEKTKVLNELQKQEAQNKNININSTKENKTSPNLKVQIPQPLSQLKQSFTSQLDFNGGDINLKGEIETEMSRNNTPIPQKTEFFDNNFSRKSLDNDSIFDGLEYDTYLGNLSDSEIRKTNNNSPQQGMIKPLVDIGFGFDVDFDFDKFNRDMEAMEKGTLQSINVQPKSKSENSIDNNNDKAELSEDEDEDVNDKTEISEDKAKETINKNVNNNININNNIDESNTESVPVIYDIENDMQMLD